ncbi:MULTISPECIES: DEAD/DEAH box helicase [Halomonas]|uniref:DEAD/DEAH box helicase family protein n=1 Tax=Halomonas alimentaria TaxID=147248 RepID=A0A7X4W4Z2_9GAMM|nr:MULTISPECIES: DEAD/DEAH box helicase family protein [Halomonas]NAW34483.1 DEAD/DEAH box helicase family protein [Halomonas alimentaria]
MKLPDTSPSTPSLHYPPLREWQQRCVDKAMQQLSPTRPHFLCQATPGAGKMLMSAVLAGLLLERGDVDFVLYLGPSRDVVSRAEQTLSEVTGLAMDGQLGARGGCYTYQSLRSRLQTLQQLGRQFRVLLIWDESHHAGRLPGTQKGANEWGQALLLLERNMALTLALSGTPWRTDGSCLPLLRYLDLPQGTQESESGEAALQQRLVPDFVYTLQQAVRDGVCRLPLIQLVDNRRISLTVTDPRSRKPKKQKQFTSIPRLLRGARVGYGDLLRHEAPMAYVLERGIARLSELRRIQPAAGGLVVASDIEHAEDIAEWLGDRGEDACLVTSQTPHAHSRLQAFRESAQAWVVSVGMISEGVDIPRLRVCCYLSHVRTEQHFRQVLGRIIRRMGEQDPDCHLVVINEPILRRYAHRIADDLPEEKAVVSVVPTEADGRGSSSSSSTGEQEAAEEPGEARDSVPDTAGVAFGSAASASTTAARWEQDMAFSRRFIAHIATLKL